MINIRAELGLHSADVDTLNALQELLISVKQLYGESEEYVVC